MVQCFHENSILSTRVKPANLINVITIPTCISYIDLEQIFDLHFTEWIAGRNYLDVYMIRIKNRQIVVCQRFRRICAEYVSVWQISIIKNRQICSSKCKCPSFSRSVLWWNFWIWGHRRWQINLFRPQNNQEVIILRPSTSLTFTVTCCCCCYVFG